MSQDPAAQNLEAWRQWLEAALPQRDHEELLGLVDESIKAGLQSDEIAAFVRARAGLTSPAEAHALERARYGLANSVGRVRAAPAAETRAEVDARWGQVLQQIEAALKALPGAALRAPAPAAAGPAFSWRRFLTEHAIQLLGYSGAFLLGIAVLLFDLSGQSPSRFFALAALDLTLFAAAYGSSRIASLRVLFRAYTAMAALALPLTMLAAYVFLDLREQMSVLTALSIGGVVCAVTYGYLAHTLAERLYAWVALGAFAAAAFCAADQVAGSEPAGGAALAATALLMIAVAPYAPAIFRGPARWLAVFVPAAGAYAALFPTTMANAPEANWALSLALAFGSATYLLMALRGEHPRLRWLAPWALTATALSVLWIWSPEHIAVQFALLALASANGVWGRLSPGVRWWQEAATAVLLVPAVLLMSDPAGSQALFFVVALAAAAAGSEVWRSRLWSFYAAGLLATGWYWFGSAVLPRPATPGPDDLARLYAALPAVFFVAGVVLRRARPQLRLPAYAFFGASTVFATWAAIAGSDGTLAGAVLLIYSALGYALTLLELPIVAPAPIAGMIAGSSLLLGARSTELTHFLLLAALWAVAVRAAAYYFGRLGRTAWVLPQRYSALVLAAASAAGAGAAAWSGTHGWLLAEPAGVQLLAAGVFAFDWRTGQRLSLYAAWAALASVTIPLASALGLADDQFRVAPLAATVLLLGVRAPTDAGLSQPRAVARWLQGGGLAVLLGFTSAQIAISWGGSSQATYTAWLATEGVLTILLGVGVRSRWPALGGGVALVLAAISSISLLASQLPLSAVFGILAAVLIIGATGLALVRGRLKGGGRSLHWATWL